MLRIYLAGDVCITAGGRLVRADRLPGRQGRLVFAYLVAERARQVSRDELVDALWPAQAPAASSLAVSAIISKLRAMFTELGLGRHAVTAGSSSYQLNLPAGSWIDVEHALESVHLAEAALQAADVKAAYGPAVVACAILRRPFLIQEEGSWVDGRRGRLRTARLRALDCLAQIHSSNGEHSLALQAAEEAVALEPYRETGYRRLMLIHRAIGNRGEAVRVYARLSALLAADLATTPSAETTQLLRAVEEV